LWGYILDFSVGYGYRPWLAFIWLTSLLESLLTYNRLPYSHA
jgi:hypothetical protein